MELKQIRKGKFKDLGHRCINKTSFKQSTTLNLKPFLKYNFAVNIFQIDNFTDLINSFLKFCMQGHILILMKIYALQTLNYSTKMRLVQGYRTISLSYFMVYLIASLLEKLVMWIHAQAISTIRISLAFDVIRSHSGAIGIVRYNSKHVCLKFPESCESVFVLQNIDVVLAKGVAQAEVMNLELSIYEFKE